MLNAFVLSALFSALSSAVVYYRCMYCSLLKSMDNKIQVERSWWYNYGWKDAGKYYEEKYANKS